MPATAQIKIDGILGSNFDFVIDTTATLTNNDDTGVTTWKWEKFQGSGPSDGITNPTSATATIHPRSETSYTIRLTVNESLVDEAIDTVVLSVRRLKTRQRTPGPGETLQASTVVGWATTVEENLIALDDAAVTADAQIGVAGENLTAQGVVRISDASTIKPGLPGEEQVPTFVKALATTEAGILGTMYIVDRTPDGDVSPESGDLFLARRCGLVLNIPGGPVDGASIYVANDGTLSPVAGTAARRVGVVTRSGGGTYDMWFDGTDDRFGNNRSLSVGDRLFFFGDGMYRLSFGALRFYTNDQPRWQVTDSTGRWDPELDDAYDIGHIEDVGPRRVRNVALSRSVLLKGGDTTDFDPSEIYDDGAAKLVIKAAGTTALTSTTTLINALLNMRIDGDLVLNNASVPAMRNSAGVFTLEVAGSKFLRFGASTGLQSDFLVKAPYYYFTGGNFYLQKMTDEDVLQFVDVGSNPTLEIGGKLSTNILKGLVYKPDAYLALAADTAQPDFTIDLARDVQFTAGGGAFPTQAAISIKAPTYKATASETMPDAYGVLLDDAPVVGTNMAITRRWACGFAPDKEVLGAIGRIKFGGYGTADQLMIGHYDCGVANYALRQTATFDSIVNAATNVYLAIGDTGVAYIGGGSPGHFSPTTDGSGATLGFSSQKWHSLWLGNNTPTGAGQIGMNTSNGRPRAYIDGASHELAHVDEIEATLKALKPSDESVTSSTLQDDDDLSVTLAASSSYAFEFLIFGTLVGATEGIKFAVGGTAGVSALKAQIELWDDTTGLLVKSGRVTAFDSTIGSTILAADNIFGRIHGTITTTGSGGTFKLRWAQNADGGDNTTVQAGSLLEVRKLT